MTVKPCRQAVRVGISSAVMSLLAVLAAPSAFAATYTDEAAIHADFRRQREAMERDYRYQRDSLRQQFEEQRDRLQARIRELNRSGWPGRHQQTAALRDQIRWYQERYEQQRKSLSRSHNAQRDALNDQLQATLQQLRDERRWESRRRDRSRYDMPGDYYWQTPVPYGSSPPIGPGGGRWNVTPEICPPGAPAGNFDWLGLVLGLLAERARH